MWQYSDQWAAGFFDGEGCIAIEPRKSGKSVSYYLTAQVSQNDVRPLEELRSRFGGSVTSASRTSNDRCSRWRVSGLKAEAFLVRIFPHLLVRRERARRALAIRALVGSRSDRFTDAQRAARHQAYERFRETF